MTIEVLVGSQIAAGNQMGIQEKGSQMTTVCDPGVAYWLLFRGADISLRDWGSLMPQKIIQNGGAAGE